ncbi:MAG: serine--tRNA ligase [Candidatus Aminicenantes bacterium]|nr:MAG: serine--tRNA ligase [Candidatus Aminicenantes bacterium]
MLDIQFIRDNPEKVKKGVSARQLDPKLVDEVLSLDKKRRELLVEIEELRAKRNQAAKAKKVEEGKKIKLQLQKLEPDLKEVESKFKKALYQIPNIVAPDVPEGKDESENKVLRKWGEPKKFDFKPKDHMELGEALDIIDTETSSKVSGTRFNYLKGDAVKLQLALIQFAFEALTDQKIVKVIAKSVKNPSDKPFVPVIPPVIAKSEIMKKMDRFDPIEDRYYLEKDDALLVGSAEHTLGPMHMDEVLTEKDLPIRYLGYSTSFRREAGTYGKDTRGIFRVHQFDKVEIESFTTSEHGDKEQELMVAIQEYLLQKLEIPYQVIMICSGEMGKPDYRQIDIECWIPGQGRYRETHTSDYMTDYQARRLNTKVSIKGKTEFVHMNDATAIAIGRTIIAILENCQQKDGSIIIPKVLQKWVGKDKIKE